MMLRFIIRLHKLKVHLFPWLEEYYCDGCKRFSRGRCCPHCP